MPRKSTATILKEMLDHKERGKESYRAAGRLEEQLVANLKPGEIVKLKDGREFELVDKFAKDVKVFQPTYVSRYTFEERKGKR